MRILVVLGLIATLTVLFTTCEQPISLGTKVNTEKPVISMPEGSETTPGVYLKSNTINVIELDVQQEFGLKEVFMDVVYIDKSGDRQTRKVPAKFNEDTKLWSVDLDTSDMGDGQITAQVTAIDVSGNTTTTTEIIYFIKNRPPQIELTIPPISGVEYEHQYLNTTRTQELLIGSSIMGIADDMAGLEALYPQIRIWPVPDAEKDFYPDLVLNADGTIPDNHPLWGKWHTVLNNDLNLVNPHGVLKATQFRWPLKQFDNTGSFTFDQDGKITSADLPLGTYRFQVRVMDVLEDTVMNYYPNRNDNSHDLDPLDPNSYPTLHKYMTIRVVAADNPRINWVDVPKFYNAKNAFRAEINVTNGNPPYNVSAQISNDDEWRDTRPVFSQTGLSQGESLEILISVDDVKRMLGVDPADTDLSKISGDKMLLIRAEDTKGGTASDRPIIIDAEPPRIQFIEPLQFTSALPPLPHVVPDRKNVTSSITIRGSVIDNQRVKEFKYALGKTAVAAVGENPDAAEWLNTNLHIAPGFEHPTEGIRAQWDGLLSSWSWEFENIADVVHPDRRENYVDPLDPGATHANNPHNLWILPIKFLAFDEAGNYYIQLIELIVDPDRDLPIVEINSHNNNQVVGGPIRINGTAEDNEMIHKVWIRLTIQDDDECDVHNSGLPIILPTHRYQIPGRPMDAEGWMEVNIPSHLMDPPNYTSMVSWNININEDGSLNPPDGKDIRRVLVEIRASDSTLYFTTAPNFKSYGPVVSRMLLFDNTVPTITEETIFFGLPNEIGESVLMDEYNTLNPLGSDVGIRYISGTTRIRGDVTFRVRVRADAGIQNIRLRAGAILIDLMQSHGNLGNKDPWIAPTANYDPENDEYFLFIPMSTSSSNVDPNRSQFVSGYQNTTGIPNMTIQVLDETTPSPYMAQTNYAFEVDNRYPLGNYKGNTMVRGNFLIEGSAWDIGTGVLVQGIERVVVYLTRNDQIINLYGPSVNGNASAFTNLNMRTNRRGNTINIEPGFEGTDISLPFPNVKQLDNTYISMPSGIVIDQIGTPEPNDSLVSSKGWSGANIVEWYAQYSTNSLSDGRYDLNYVIFDRAGNATHYSEEIYIANNAPVITSISLGTDVNGENPTILPNDFFKTYGDGVSTIGNAELTTDYRIRNSRFDLQINTDTTKGNNNKNYVVSYVTRNAENSFTTITKGQVYTISDVGTNVNWVNYGLFGTPVIGATFAATNNYSSTDPGEAGMVFSYNYTGGTTSIASGFGSGNHAVSDISFTGYAPTADASFGPELIPDSTGIILNETTGEITWSGKNESASDANKRFFLIHVYDDTVPTGNKEDQLSHVVLINVGINNVDEFAPRMALAEIGEKYIINAANPNNYIERKMESLDDSEYNQNIVTTTEGVKKGYVQYTEHNGIRADTSGMVIFKGKAMDNSQVRRIFANIPGYNTNLLIAQWNTTTNRLESAVAGNTITAMRTNDDIEWGFETTDQALTMEYGHVLNWNFAFDTSKISTIVANNVTITFTAYDSLTNGNPSTPVTININIIPYIADIITDLTSAFSASPSAFSRSALGWYPVRENTDIRIRGFNLGTSGTTTTVRLNDTPLTAGTITNREIIADIGTTATSGDLIVTVNSIASINNVAHEFAHYNNEGNNINNDRLSNNRRLYVWNTGVLYNDTEQWPIRGPYMRMHSDSRWFMSYGGSTTGNAFLYVFRSAVATGRLAIQQDTNRFLNTTIALDSAGDFFIAASNQTANGGRVLSFIPKPTGNTGGNSTTTGAHRRIMDLGIDANQVRIPRVFAQNTNDGASSIDSNATRIFMSYYAASVTNNPLRFIYGTVGTTPAANTGFGGNFTAAGGTGWSTGTVVANNTTRHQGSMYSATGALSNGLPIVAWYDRNNMELVLSHGGTVNAAGNWNSSPLDGSSLTTTLTNTTTTAIDLNVTSSSIEYVYTNTGHGLTGTGVSRNSQVFVKTSPTHDYVFSDLRYARSIGSDRFTLSSVENGSGQDLGSTIIVDKAIPVTEVVTSTGAGVGAAQHSGMPGNFTANVRKFRLPADHGLRLGDVVDIINGGTAYRNLFVTWLGIPGQGNSNDVVFKTDNANFVPAGTNHFNTIAATNAAGSVNMYIIIKSRADINITVSSVQDANTNNSNLNTGRSGIYYTNASGTTANIATAVPNPTRTFTLSANHGLTLGDRVQIVYNGLTYNLVIGFRGTANNANINSVGLKNTIGTTANWFNTVPAGTAGNLVTITRINNPIGTVINAIRSEERIYTPSTGLTVGRTFVIDTNSYRVIDVWGNNFKIINNETSVIPNIPTPFNISISGSTGHIVNTPTFQRDGGSGTATNPDRGTWQGNARVVQRLTGSHVDMAIDGNDNIHLAYYDVLNGGLWYAYVPVRINENGALMPNMDNIQTAKVDTYLSAGTKIMLNVRLENDRYVPYISYNHGSFSETRNSVRVAWRKEFSDGVMPIPNGTDENDRFTGAWEVMTVPVANAAISDEFVINGVPTSGNLNSTSVTFTLTPRPMAQTILVGYMTDRHYEGAVLKHDLWTPPAP